MHIAPNSNLVSIITSTIPPVKLLAVLNSFNITAKRYFTYPRLVTPLPSSQLQSPPITIPLLHPTFLPQLRNLSARQVSHFTAPDGLALFFLLSFRLNLDFFAVYYQLA